MQDWRDHDEVACPAERFEHEVAVRRERLEDLPLSAYIVENHVCVPGSPLISKAVRGEVVSSWPLKIENASGSGGMKSRKVTFIGSGLSGSRRSERICKAGRFRQSLKSSRIEAGGLACASCSIELRIVLGGGR